MIDETDTVVKPLSIIQILFRAIGIRLIAAFCGFLPVMMIWISIDAKSHWMVGAWAIWWGERSFGIFLTAAFAVAFLFAAWPGSLVALGERFMLLLEKTHARRS